jgi:hypothetical protein
MAELLGALLELFVALITFAVEVVPAFFQALFFLLLGSFTIVAYAFSARFRAKKQLAWKTSPGRKYLELGGSAACLLAIAAFAIWLFVFQTKPAANPRSTDTAVVSDR